MGAQHLLDEIGAVEKAVVVGATLGAQGLSADCFINSEPTDLQAITMHACAFTFVIELTGDTRHLSKREQAVDAIVAACDLVPRLNAMTFSDARSEAHRAINRVHVGVVHGALGKELHEWRAPQVADFARIKGSGRSIAGFHLRDALDLVAKRHPGVLLRFGGHAMAAGCTLAQERLDEFDQALQQVASEWLDAATLTRRLATDGPLAPEYRRADMVDVLQQGVWGQGFAPPLFSEEVQVLSQRLVGERHLALKLKHQGQPVDGIWFGHTEPLPAKATLAFRLEADEWQGQRLVRFLVEGVQT